jgi:hypothetical protein
MIAVSVFVLAAYVGVEAVRTLVGGHHPETSWVGIALAAVTTTTMPLLARAKRRVGDQLDSSATVKEGASEHGLRVPVRRPPRRSPSERGRRLVVGRPGSRLDHRRCGSSGRARKLARRRLLRCLLSITWTGRKLEVQDATP